MYHHILYSQQCHISLPFSALNMIFLPVHSARYEFSHFMKWPNFVTKWSRLFVTKWSDRCCKMELPCYDMVQVFTKCSDFVTKWSRCCIILRLFNMVLNRRDTKQRFGN